LVEIMVEDNGIGFDMAYVDQLFKPFTRLVGSSAYEGSGMGLPICQKIAARHGGRISAKGSPGAGAQFTITLPGKLPA
jgi:signal transduction histidine kinase